MTPTLDELREVTDKIGVTIVDMKEEVDKLAKRVRVAKILCIALAFLVFAFAVWYCWPVLSRIP
jgi:hypothetical protein